MTTRAIETWSGANGAAWPAQWTRSGDTGNASSIQANRGRLTTGSAIGYPSAVAMLTGLAARTDTTVLATFYPTATTPEQWAFVRVRASGVGTNGWEPLVGYQLWCYLGTDNLLHTYVRRYNGAGTQTDLIAQSNPAVAWSTTAGISVRLEAVGSTVRYKVWAGNASEPTAWTGSATDASPLGAGQVGIAVTGPSPAAVTSIDWDNLTVTDGVAPAAVSTLTDDFTTADSAKWFGYDANSSVVSGQLRQTILSSYASGLSSNVFYDLTGSSMHATLVQAPNVGNGSTEAYFKADIDANNYVGWLVGDGNQLIAERKVAGTRTTINSWAYSPTTHQRLRVRESGGTIFWDTYDGTTWTNRASWALAGFAVTSVKPSFVAGYWSTETSPGTVIWDDFNPPPFQVLQRVKAATTTQATTLTATLPGAATVGSKQIALITVTSGSAGITMPAGWTQRATNTAMSANCFVYDRTTAATTDTSLALTFPSGGAVIYLIEVAGLTGGFASAVATSGLGPSATFTAGPLTPATASTYLLAFVAHDTNATDAFGAPVTLTDQHQLAGATSALFHNGYAEARITSTSAQSVTVTPSASVSGWEALLIAYNANAPVPTLTLPFTETWTGTDGAGWGANWDSTAFTSVTPDIQGNAGRIRSGTTAFSYSRAYLQSAPATTDTELLVTFTFATQAEAYLALCLNADNTGLASDTFFPTNGYALQIKCGSTSGTGSVGLFKFRAGGTAAETDTTSESSSGKVISAGTAYKARFQRVSNSLRWKVWDAATSEPPYWTTVYTDTGTLLPAGRPLLTYSNGTAATQTQVILDDFTVAAPSSSDITPPSVPTGVTATATSPTSVTVTWAASTDAVGVAGYRVARGANTWNVTSPTLSYTDSGPFTIGSTYNWTVSAYDAAGNRSAESSTASATIPATANLDKLKLGAGTVGLRVGSAVANKAYIGTTQVWP